MSVTDEPSGDETVYCKHCGHEVSAGRTPYDNETVFEAPPEDEAFAVLVRTGLERKIHVNCGSCGRGLKVSLRMAGRQTTCPACDNRVRLPFAGQEAERHIEELMAQRSPQVMAAETEAPDQAPGEEAPAVMQIAESALAELARFVETDGADDATLDIPEDDDLMRRSTEALEGREILALNEAISAFASSNGVSASDELPALQEAVGRHPRRTAAGMSGRQKTLLLTVAATVCVAVGIWLAAGFFGGSESETDPDNSTASIAPNNNTPQVKTNTITSKPSKDPTPGIGPVIRPVKAKATCRVVTCAMDSFAGGGFFPAGPGRLFCQVRAEVTAGDDKLELYNHGKAAVLRIGLESYPSLGEPVKSILPALPHRKHLSIPARGSRTITMLFELPQKAVGAGETTGIVSLGKIGPASVKLGSPAHVLPAKAVADSSSPYVETAPRNTKPLLSDPVMSAIQQTMPQKLSVRPGPDNSVKLTLGSGEVTGTARPDARGLYVTKLTHNGSTLQCLLRFAHGGKEAILYLSEEPFHQLTFARPGWAKTVPIVIQSQGRVRPKPRLDPPDPEPTTRPKTTPGTGRPRQPGFFGV